MGSARYPTFLGKAVERGSYRRFREPWKTWFSRTPLSPPPRSGVGALVAFAEDPPCQEREGRGTPYTPSLGGPSVLLPPRSHWPSSFAAILCHSLSGVCVCVCLCWCPAPSRKMGDVRPSPRIQSPCLESLGSRSHEDTFAQVRLGRQFWPFGKLPVAAQAAACSVLPWVGLLWGSLGSSRMHGGGGEGWAVPLLHNTMSAAL